MAPLLSADVPSGYSPTAYAIQGARIVVGTGTTIEKGTVIVRHGLIEAVGDTEKVAVPYDAELIDGKGLVVYPGFIDLYTTLGQPAGVTRSGTGPARSVSTSDEVLARTPPDNRNGLTPEFEVASVLALPESLADERRRLGFTDLLAAPAGAIATGQSALVGLSGLPRREALVRHPVALHINLRTPFEPAAAPATTPDDDRPAAPRTKRQAAPGDGGPRYPLSLMGVVAHLRQAMLDADYQRALQGAYAERKGPRPAFDPTLEALSAARSKAIPVWWEANTRDEIHRALDLAEEFGTTAVIVGGREAAKVVDRLKEKDVPVVLRLDFGEEPKVPAEAEYRKRDLAEREEPIRVVEQRRTRWKEQVGAAQALGRAGVRFAFSSDGLAKAETFHSQVRTVIAAGLTAEAAVDALTRRAAEIAGLAERLGTIEPGKLGHLVVTTAPYGGGNGRIRYVLIDGLKFDLDRPAPPRVGPGGGAEKKARPEETKPEPPQASARAQDVKPAETQAPAPAPAPTQPPAPAPAPAPAAAQPASADDQGPKFADVASELDENRKPRIRTAGTVLIKDATILTVTRGTIPKGSILVQNGKIAAVGTEVQAPQGIAVIEAAGLVAMPGIIDTHSHMAIQGGVNEVSSSIVPEVRIKDVITGDDPALYRALAGGTTTARILHGSADTIGGQDAVIKLRHGRPGRELLVADAPQGVKFALGENVKRSQGRFPNTRMGVQATIERAFEEAKAYRQQWAGYEAATTAAAQGQGPAGVAPRRDLRLEALAGVLDGSIKIHSHCYRQDEILMLLNVAARYGVRVQSLQHVLEGYKAAPEIALHGASASTFSDWWAYKMEAYEAIPYNAALLIQAGARVCIKSDSEELVRHLNLEAAKTVKYGGVTETQALEMITINPARELGLEARLGSIEVGKDADIALFNAHPFDAFARCELALIDGEVWFQREEKDGGFAPRGGDHTVMPGPSEAVRSKKLEITPNPKGTYALVGATLHPVSGADIAGGTLIIVGGKIDALGGADTAVPAGAQTIDVHGLDIWPGIVDAGSQLGLIEIASIPETSDYNEISQFGAELRASTALHTDSRLIPVTRANGILSTYVQPAGGLISGQGCLIDLDGWVPRELLRADEVALNVNIPRNISSRGGGGFRGRFGGGGGGDAGAERQRRRERIESLKQQFRRALDYDKVRAVALARHAASPAPDPGLAALVPYAKGEKPVVFRAEHRNEILDALKIAEELKLKAVISGAADGWKVAEALKAASVPVVIGGTLQLPTEPTDPYDAAYANPARLFEAGVTIAIRSNDGGPEQATAGRNLPYEAATAVAFGQPEAEAVKAVTLAPAQILGVADQVGSLEPGKRANLVITAGHILQPTTDVKALFIGGKPLGPETMNEQAELYARYQQRLAGVKAGTLPLGLDPAQTGASAGAPSSPAPAPMPPLTGPNPATTTPPARR
jgi:imidazolonepropionase-like amidohydrolase